MDILNNGASTRIEYNTETCIDLTIATPKLGPLLQWTVTATPRDSDHIPIVSNMLNEIQREGQATRRYMKKVDWVKNRESEAWKHLDMDMSSTSNEEIMLNFYTRIDRAAEESIPKIVRGKVMPKPFWNERLRQTRDKTKAIQVQQNKVNSKLILWKSAKAEYRRAVVEKKRASWIKIANTLNYKTTKATIYENLRKIKGFEKRKLTY